MFKIEVYVICKIPSPDKIIFCLVCHDNSSNIPVYVNISLCPLLSNFKVFDSCAQICVMTDTKQHMFFAGNENLY